MHTDHCPAEAEVRIADDCPVEAEVRIGATDQTDQQRELLVEITKVGVFQAVPWARWPRGKCSPKPVLNSASGFPGNQSPWSKHPTSNPHQTKTHVVF